MHRMPKRPSTSTHSALRDLSSKWARPDETWFKSWLWAEKCFVTWITKVRIHVTNSNHRVELAFSKHDRYSNSLAHQGGMRLWQIYYHHLLMMDANIFQSDTASLPNSMSTRTWYTKRINCSHRVLGSLPTYSSHLQRLAGLIISFLLAHDRPCCAVSLREISTHFCLRSR